MRASLGSMSLKVSLQLEFYYFLSLSFSISSFSLTPHSVYYFCANAALWLDTPLWGSGPLDVLVLACVAWGGVGWRF